jgi:S-(hydroxymethyl)glutathione dehydrogenase/alcohol dehydrogenase
MAIPRTMKAAILVDLCKPLVVEEIELPPALDAGQVLVKVHYSGICGSQLGEIDGAKGEDKFLPHLLGHEGSGTVLEVGPGVRHMKASDKVVLHWRKGLGIDSQMPSYRWGSRTVNAGWVTTFNEYAIVSENRATPIPEDSDMEVAALFGCAVTTGFGVVVNNAKVRIGDSVVVYGAGGIGLNIVQAAYLAGAHPIIAVDLHDGRLELAGRMGATHLLNATETDVGKRIRDIIGAADVFRDNTGLPTGIELGYRAEEG